MILVRRSTGREECDIFNRVAYTAQRLISVVAHETKQMCTYRAVEGLQWRGRPQSQHFFEDGGAKLELGQLTLSGVDSPHQRT